MSSYERPLLEVVCSRRRHLLGGADGRTKSLKRADAVALPRFVTIAVGNTAVHVFGYRGTEAYMIGSIPRDSVQVEISSGLFWTRLTLIDPAAARSYMAFLGRIIPGRKALLSALRAL